MLMSDERYQSFVDFLQLNHLLPCSQTVLRHRKAVNEKISELYDVLSTGIHASCDFIPVIRDIYRVHFKECTIEYPRVFGSFHDGMK